MCQIDTHSERDTNSAIMQTSQLRDKAAMGLSVVISLATHSCTLCAMNSKFLCSLKFIARGFIHDSISHIHVYVEKTGSQFACNHVTTYVGKFVNQRIMYGE